VFEDDKDRDSFISTLEEAATRLICASDQLSTAPIQSEARNGAMEDGRDLWDTLLQLGKTQDPVEDFGDAGGIAGRIREPVDGNRRRFADCDLYVSQLLPRGKVEAELDGVFTRWGQPPFSPMYSAQPWFPRPSRQKQIPRSLSDFESA